MKYIQVIRIETKSGRRYGWIDRKFEVGKKYKCEKIETFNGYYAMVESYRVFYNEKSSYGIYKPVLDENFITIEKYRDKKIKELLVY